MLFSLAQAINRIRSGWTPPLPATAVTSVTTDAEPRLSAAATEGDS